MSIPKEWLETTHYELHMAWLTSKLEERISPDSPETTDHPGWWTRYKINSYRDSLKDLLELATAEASVAITNWELDQDPDIGQQKAPYQATVVERQELLKRFLASKRSEVDEDGLMYELFQPYDHYALLVQIFFSSFQEEFETTFGAANSPVRSLEGKLCRLINYQTNEVLSEGTAAIQGNRLTVGFWSKEFAGSLEVNGTAYAEAFWVDSGVQFYLFELEGDE
jgi:hypothetical protein